DFKQRFFDTKFKNISDVTLARLIIIGSGLLSLALAIYLMLGNTSQTWNLFLAITGIFGVPIAGIFAVGIFTEKANTPGVLTGLIASAIITYFVQAAAVSPFIVSCVSFIAAFVISYIISLLTPNYRKNIVGLTVSTKDQDYVK
ncbi:MAG: Na+/proline symporter, partial [Loigolactobacillus coryniformis]|nr:Na+/proline symporter [Loigolactobacillus coryniformis]